MKDGIILVQGILQDCDAIGVNPIRGAIHAKLEICYLGLVVQGFEEHRCLHFTAAMGSYVYVFQLTHLAMGQACSKQSEIQQFYINASEIGVMLKEGRKEAKDIWIRFA